MAQVDLLFVIVSCLSSAVGGEVAQVDLLFVIVLVEHLQKNYEKA